MMKRVVIALVALSTVSIPALADQHHNNNNGGVSNVAIVSQVGLENGANIAQAGRNNNFDAPRGCRTDCGSQVIDFAKIINRGRNSGQVSVGD